MAHASGDNKSGSQPSEEQVVGDEEIGHVRVVTLNSLIISFSRLNIF
jgi:hypothetical protein